MEDNPTNRETSQDYATRRITEENEISEPTAEFETKTPQTAKRARKPKKVDQLQPEPPEAASIGLASEAAPKSFESTSPPQTSEPIEAPKPEPVLETPQVKRKDKDSSVAIAIVIAVCAVILACICACTAIAITFLMNAPW